MGLLAHKGRLQKFGCQSVQSKKQNDLLFNFKLMHCLIFQGKNTDEKALNEKTKIASDLKSVYDKLRENDENCANALKTAQARFEAISVGKFSSDEGQCDLSCGV